MQNFLSLYINGEWVEPQGKERCDVVGPASESVIGSVPSADPNDVNNAVQAARNAFDSWSQTSAKDRARWIEAIAAGMEQRLDELAEIVSNELGMPLHLARNIQVAGPIAGLRSYLKLAEKMESTEQFDNAIIVKEPIGVCAFINPWNYPLHQLIGKLAPALAAGCTMVVKPSEETPLHAFAIAEIIHEAGLPPGVFNLVTGPGKLVGEALCSHPDADMVSFTGSTTAGIRIAELAAPTVKRVCQELGGKSPFIITESADLRLAVEYGVRDIMMNSGQTCTALSRMLVPATLHDEVVEIASELANHLVVGNPEDPKSDLGPMCSARQLAIVLSYIDKGIQEGAKLVAGGSARPNGLLTGFYIQPTIFADVNNAMTIAREEIFGPVLCIIPYQSEAEAIAIANDTDFGLSAAVWAGSQHEALRVGRSIRAGQVFINGGEFSYQAPFGGYKQSGNGREWGDKGLSEFIECKALMI